MVSRAKIDKMVKNFVKAVDNLDQIYCADLDDTADAIELIGLKLRSSKSSRGFLLFAKAIIDRAASAN